MALLFIKMLNDTFEENTEARVEKVDQVKKQTKV
jgi:hypothetical protein